MLYFDPNSSRLNFDPQTMEGPGPLEAPTAAILQCVAEQTIMQTIMEGSAGLPDEEPSLPALRFVRHILTISRPAQHGFLPNFKSVDTIRRITREYIAACGGAGAAIHNMLDVMQ